jgi:subtilisin family serine protease
VQSNHPDLTGHVLSGFDFVCGKAGASVDPNGHGTHVAGIAAARDNSIFGLGGAPDARILPVRVLGSSGQGSTGDVAAGIYWAVDHAVGVDVINLSLGSASPASAMQNAVAYAEANGVVVAAAAGNDNTSAKLYPAGFDGEVIAVGASIKSQPSPPYDPPFTKAGYSNYGSWVDIGAPGSAVYSTYKGSGFSSLSGTSMATPFVSAAAALVLERCPLLDPDQVLAYLQAGATNPVNGLMGANHLAIDDALANPC